MSVDVTPTTRLLMRNVHGFEEVVDPPGTVCIPCTGSHPAISDPSWSRDHPHTYPLIATTSYV